MLPSQSALNSCLLRVGQGDRGAFADLYRATSAKVYGILLRTLRNRAVADEVLQESYVRVWRHAATFDPERASAITWIATIARNLAFDELRKARPASSGLTSEELEISDPQLLPIERLELDEDYMRLQRCLEGLEPERRKLVCLAYLEGRSREELGKLLGHPASTIKTWLHRSLKQLKTCLST